MMCQCAQTVGLLTLPGACECALGRVPRLPEILGKRLAAIVIEGTLTHCFAEGRGKINGHN